MTPYIALIQRGIDFAESKLDEDVTLAEVARAGGLSQWHFQRIFRSLTGETLKGYKRSRRLARSLERLLDGRLRVLDVAILAGYESQESYARAFKKEFGVTPTDVRRSDSSHRFLHKLQLDALAMQHLTEGVSLEPEIREQAAFRLVGLRTTYYGVDSAKNNLSRRLPALWAAFVPRVAELNHADGAALYGVVAQTAEDSDLLAYLAAAAWHDHGTLPKGMQAVTVPAGRYAFFEHRGAAADLDRTVSHAYATWLLRSGHRHTGGPDLEVYDHRYSEKFLRPRTGRRAPRVLPLSRPSPTPRPPARRHR